MIVIVPLPYIKNFLKCGEGDMDIVIDFDNTLVNSSEAVFKLCEKEFGHKINYNMKDLKWDFGPYIVNEKEFCRKAFASKDLYKEISFIDEYAKDTVLKLLNDNRFNPIICSKRDLGGFDPIVEWLEDNGLKGIKYAFVSSYDKSFVGSSNSIIIDDKPDAIMNGTRLERILFGDYGYQKDEMEKYNSPIIMKDGYYNRINNWKDVGLFIETVTNLYM